MLYIMRHGLTDWNTAHRLQGQTDTDLNEDGIQMAKDAAVEYKDIHFDVCYCSPLKRARMTAELLLEGRDVPIIFDDRLKEMSFGIYEGFANCFSFPDCPMYAFFKHPEEYKAVLGAESMDELFARTGEFLREVALPQTEAGKDVLIVGHGAMNSSIVCQVKGRERSEFWADPIPNCKLQQLY